MPTQLLGDKGKGCSIGEELYPATSELAAQDMWEVTN